MEGKGYQSKWLSNNNQKNPVNQGKIDSGLFDVRGMTPGTIVEYTNAKGSRRVVLINKRLNRYLEVTNDVMKVFKIPINRVNYLVEGDYAFEDMRNLSEIVRNLGPGHIERVYDKLTKADSFISSNQEENIVAYTLEYISNTLHPLLGDGSSFTEEGKPMQQKTDSGGY